MEWVETVARTLEEAKGLALDQLGAAEEDVEFEILEEPKSGLFGRVRGEARVRARVRPTQARQKVDRRDRRKTKDDAADGSTDGAATAESTPRKKTARGPRPTKVAAPDQGDQPAIADDAADQPKPERAKPARASKPKSPRSTDDRTVSDRGTRENDVSAEQVGQEAVRFLDGLVSAFGLDGASEVIADGDDLEVRVAGDNLGLLVGPRGTTLQAVQDLTRVAAQRRLGDHDTRLRIDVGGYRERRRIALNAFALKQAEEVTATGVARVLEPMSSADRKVIHDTLGAVDGVVTRSEGDDPYRHVVIAPVAS